MPGRQAYRTEKTVGMQAGRQAEQKPQVTLHPVELLIVFFPLRQMDRYAASTEPSVG